MTEPHAPSRRQFLLGSGALFAWAHLPKAALADGRDPRFLTVVLRGALDGLAAVAPVGDPSWVKLRGDMALRLDGANAALPLDGFFALHPAMPKLHQIYHAGHAVILHASATPYRDRSHFDGQDVLESGLPGPGTVHTGWLNRALTTIAPADRIAGSRRSALAIGATAPLIVRGPAQIVSWAPPSFPSANADTLSRLLDLYRHTDPALAAALEERVGLSDIVGAEPTPQNVGGEAMRTRQAANVRSHFARSAGAAAKILARPDGPRIGALSFTGWDTHVNEGAVNGRLATLLGALDDSISAIKTEMGPAWRETVVAVVTEFGRTAEINGSFGTDHGTATVAILAGGALKGGRVIADWPGLAYSQLYQGRDLMPTMDLRAPLKGLLRDHLRVPEAALAKIVFPDSEKVGPMSGLLA